MKKVFTREEYKAYAESRKGVRKYRICHVEDGKPVSDMEFDAKSDEDALAELGKFKESRPGREYFWKYVHEYVLAREDGMFEVSERLVDEDDLDCARTEEKENGGKLVHGDFLEFVRTYDYSRGRTGVYVPDGDGRVEDPYEDEKRAYDDLSYLVKSYDPETGKAHSRCESWSLDSHILDDIEHNVPLIMADKYGVPTPFCERAREVLGTKPAKGEEYSFSEEEMTKAKELWNEKLQELLDHVRLYDLYSGYGIVDERGEPGRVEFQKKHAADIPYRPGSYKEIDYKALTAMAQAEWKAIWAWMAEWGQSLWT